ncbi:MAG TPA: hypothetical protein VG944_19525 [Fimbriimonas sp.]|nr:hypothetical protein [Fimbriimonas sp.]
MDEETKALLKEIADQLRTRNEMAAARQEEAQKSMEEYRSRWGGDHFEKLKERVEQSQQDRMASEERLKESTERAKTIAERDGAFQSELLLELRQLNTILERFVDRGSAFL